ncbi:unnamed protein product [Cylindrotheca closterium]|uniref:Uncharacterized protein n=1 Tax=Cylindrotheca closterium TaxID=2856 RepID=A0AAD2CT68_9STRA|nr:unnamed protein product [Cylindrotheca closterium]
MATLHLQHLPFQMALMLLLLGLSSTFFQGASAFSTLPQRPYKLTRASRLPKEQSQHQNAFASARTPVRGLIIGMKLRRQSPILYKSNYSAGTTPEGEPSTAEVSSSSTTSSTNTIVKPPFSTTLLGTIIRKIFSPIAYLQRCIFRAITKSTAAFLTAVISEPGCNQAFATVIMRGCNMVLTSNKLKERLVAAQTTLSETEPSLAKLTGEDFFKVLAQFVIGLIDPSFEYAPKKENDD